MDRRTPSASTSAVLLRDVTEDDLPIFFEQQLDPIAIQMAAFPSRERQVFMAHWAKILADTTVITQTILFDLHVAGNVVPRHSFICSGFGLPAGMRALHSACDGIRSGFQGAHAHWPGVQGRGRSLPPPAQGSCTSHGGCGERAARYRSSSASSVRSTRLALSAIQSAKRSSESSRLRPLISPIRSSR
jgi:hypothetical protein